MDRNNIKLFERDTDYYYGKAMEKSDAGDYVGCLDFLYRACEQINAPYSDEDLDIRIEIADTYTAMGLYEESNREYFKLTAFDYCLDDVFYGIVKNYALSDMPEQAAYYLNIAVEAGILLSEDGFEAIDPEWLERPDQTQIRLLKPGDNAHIVQAAKQLLNFSDTDFARQILKSVPESSEQYGEASNYLALIEISDGNVDDGLKLCDRILENEPENLNAATTKILALYLDGRKKDALDAFAVLDALDLNEWPASARVGLCACQIGETEFAYKYLTRALVFMPYDRELLLLFTLAAANSGKYREAKDAAVRLQIIYQRDVAVRYYVRIIDGNRTGKTDFELTPELPKAERGRLGALLDDALEKYGVTFAARLAEDDALQEAVCWGLHTGNYAVAAKLGRILARAPEGYAMVRELLVDPEYPLIPKKEIFSELLRGGKVRAIQMVVNHQIQWYRPHIPKEVHNKTLQEAYWKVYSALAFIDSDFDRKLNLWFKKIAAAFKQAGVTAYRENAVAAVLAYKSRINKIFSQIAYACEVFDCTEEDFMLYYNVLNGPAAQKESAVRSKKRTKNV